MQFEMETEDESEEESMRQIKRPSSPVAENNDADETKIQLVDHNWSFLSTIFPQIDDIELS